METSRCSICGGRVPAIGDLDPIDDADVITHIPLGNASDGKCDLTSSEYEESYNEWRDFVGKFGEVLAPFDGTLIV